MANASEYWAEGSQAWFDATIRTGGPQGVEGEGAGGLWEPRTRELVAGRLQKEFIA